MHKALYERVAKLPKANIINLMWDALDYMQQYNGRGKGECVAMAMGAEEVKEGKWELPSQRELKSHTKYMSPF